MLSIANRGGNNTSGASAHNRSRLLTAAADAERNLGIIGNRESNTSKSMYSPNGSSNMLTRAAGMGAAALKQGPPPPTSFGQPGIGGGGNRRADMLAMLNRPGPTQVVAIPQQRATEMSLNERIADAGRQAPQQQAPQQQAPQYQEPQYQEPAQPRVNPAAAYAVPMPEPEGRAPVPLEIRRRGQGGLPRAAAVQALTAPAALQAGSAGIDQTVAELAEQVRQLQRQILTLSAQPTNLQADFAAQRAQDIENVSAEMSNSCCVSRATVLHNTVECVMEHEPSTRGTQDDDNLLAAGLEDSNTTPVAAGTQVVLVYPMYSRSLEDAGMGNEIYMRRRQIDPVSAEVKHTYIKVMGTYGEQTLQYIGDFAI
jgi:hypothetical protein